MVNKKWFVISYCCAFMSVFLCSIAYAMLPAVTTTELPQTETTKEMYNMTMTAIPNLFGLNGAIIFIITIALIAICLFLLSNFSMRMSI